jgi:hypothetical protein
MQTPRLIPTKGDPAMVGVKCSLSHASTKYWVDVIQATAWSGGGLIVSARLSHTRS